MDKQEAADELCKTLISASYSSRPLHGGIDQYDRDSTMSDFKSGAVKILIATSVAARGLDVKSLILVGNDRPAGPACRAELGLSELILDFPSTLIRFSP